ncbi:MAG: fructose-6-phosphate aldolase [Planctomycetes bacterium]|nr:fructose-6-phosphate aldolase [Planctomycetota bacterium]
MKFFIDTASVSEIREALAMGLLDGVTTNPSLIAKEKRGFRETVEEILSIVPGPVSIEVVATDYKGMLAEAREIVRMGENAVVKIPLTLEGIKATKALSEGGVKVNNTLCFSPLQALLSAKAGAAYISPFVGRLDDRGHEGMEIVRDIRGIYDNYDFRTELLVASVRSPLHVLEAARIGADVATVPYAVLCDLIKHPLTDVGLAKFLEDWKKVGETVIRETAGAAR